MGIVRNIMIVKKSKELTFLATEAGMTEKEFSKTIVCELVKNEWVYDEPDSWGQNVFECLKKCIWMSDVVNLLKGLGIKNVKSEQVEAFFALIFMGCGDCPECGGEMEVTDAEYKRCGGDGYITPYEYEPIWEERQCANCGYRD